MIEPVCLIDLKDEGIVDLVHFKHLDAKPSRKHDIHQHSRQVIDDAGRGKLRYPLFILGWTPDD
jgi:hypothetical protein